MWEKEHSDAGRAPQNEMQSAIGTSAENHDTKDTEAHTHRERARASMRMQHNRTSQAARQPRRGKYPHPHAGDPSHHTAPNHTHKCRPHVRQFSAIRCLKEPNTHPYRDNTHVRKAFNHYERPQRAYTHAKANRQTARQPARVETVRRRAVQVVRDSQPADERWWKRHRCSRSMRLKSQHPHTQMDPAHTHGRRAQAWLS